ncbi:DUF1440 domain-containing protein [Loigolactobacillus coryniformis]|jgi:putative membrane protein|uniref:DUF1440 domain-containing protein n=1 Tax=Loigolactobacillus coryniformis TaxID=1610 RepID=UPI00201ACEE2|nr:DUF1440 domain-containing protein [Loigolactobacillus coryniformis]MCL5458768.1 DUF1440 domain-containing protein [Loigolactobacillus coryniformis]
MKMTKKVALSTLVAAGATAGLVSGLVKLGWEALLPPRTPERDATNPPQTFLQQHGLSYAQTHKTYRYNGHDVPWVSLMLHFGFSSGIGALYSVTGHYLPFTKLGNGAAYGLATWAGAHLLAMPTLGIVPTAKDQPMPEHISEAAGHMVWNWVNQLTIDQLLIRWGQHEQK